MSLSLFFSFFEKHLYGGMSVAGKCFLCFNRNAMSAFRLLKKTHAGEKDGRLRAKFLYPNLKRMQGLHFAHQGNGALNGSSGRSLSPQTTLKKDGANDAEEHLHLPKKKNNFLKQTLWKR